MNSISQSASQLNHEFPETLHMFGWWDAVLAVIVLCVSIAAIPVMKTHTPDKLLIFKENRIIATYPLATDRIFTVQGALGPLTLQIKDHAVSVQSSTCPHHICQRSGAISRPSAQLICAPNHILVTITSTVRDPVDAIAR